MITEEFERVLPEIPRSYTALAEWLSCMVCISRVNKRLCGFRFAAVCMAALFAQSLFLLLTGELAGILWIVCMLAAVGMMYLFICACVDMNRKDCAYFCASAFVLAEFAASVEWQLDCFFSLNMKLDTKQMHLLCLFGIYGIIFFFAWYANKDYLRGEEKLLVTNGELVSYSVIALAVFSISNLGFITVKTPFFGHYMTEVYNIRTLIDFGGLAILYAYHTQRMELKARHELSCVQEALRNQYVLYQQAQEAVELIHYKHHDLKHHILVLRAEENAQKRNCYLDKIEEEIRMYEAQYRTGNQVLDTILTAKSLSCMRSGVTMSCVVDGSLFSFMDEMDICSVFGNALDNALEAVKKLPEEQKRLIHVSAFLKHDFLIIRFENYCEDLADFEGKFPASTKKDARFHGYGLKSIRYTVHKYQGETNVSCREHWFCLSILIPYTDYKNS